MTDSGRYDKEYYGKEKVLYKTEAMERGRLVNDVNYLLKIALHKGDSFEGRIEISFDWQPMVDKQDLFLDAHVLGVNSIVVNNKNIDVTE